MKEVKLKPLAKITEEQLQTVRGNISQINSLGKALDRAYQAKESTLGKLRKAYSLSDVDFYVDLRTGAVLECWPKA